VGAQPIRFAMKQTVDSVDTTIGMCSVEAGLCEASGPGANFTVASGSSLVAVVYGSNFVSGTYTAVGFYRDSDGTQLSFTKTVEGTHEL